ncbi:hypothetical protein [Hyphomicrobium sp.]|jgi:hypothetical protein|uniref:hypothetical protein n=1 Tax=Hyphomicrobium sp. TaxID=82 RepID=UPI003567121A
MKALIIAAVAAAAFSGGTFSAQALEETDRAMGAGSYVNPNGSEKGAWTQSSSRVSHAGAVVTRTKH